MRLLVIGLDTQVLDPASDSAQRQLGYFVGYEVDILILGRGAVRCAALSSSVRVEQPGGRTSWQAWWRTFCTARRLLHRYSYAVVTVQDPYFCASVGYAARLGTGARLHIQDHSAAFTQVVFGIKGMLLHLWSHWIVRHADRIRTVSRRGAAGLMRAGVTMDKIDILPVATDVSKFVAITHQPSESQQILCVARLTREKGVDILLLAMREVLYKYPSVHLTLVGDGPERRRLETLARELKIEQAVEFAGAQSAVAPFLAQANIYVQPSRFEGWGRAIIEAAAAGVPIVMTDVGCAGEVIKNGESGVVVPTENWLALAEAILGLISDPVRAERLTQAALQSVQALPSVEQSVLNVRASLEKTAGAQPSSSAVPLFLAACAARLVPFILILAFVGSKGLELGDSIQYLGLAKALLAGHGFALDGTPFFYRTIGYPLFLAGGLAVFQSTAGFILFQIVLASFVPLAVLRLGRELRLGKRATWIAAWITALEPHLVYYSLTIMTESIYTLLLLIGFIYIFRAMETKRLSDSVRTGVVFGIGMLLKPLLQFFPPVLFLLMLPWWRRINWRQVLIHAAVIMVTIGVVVSPWIYRNYRTFWSFSLSSQGSDVALFYLGTSIVALRDHISYQVAETKVRQDFISDTGLSLAMRGTDQSTVRSRVALSYIKENPSIFVRLLAINTISFWTSSNYNSFLNYYHLIPRIDHSVLPPTHYLAQGRVGDLFSSFWKIFSQPFYLVGVLGRIIWIILTTLFVYGLLAAYRRIPERRFQLLCLVAVCMYFTMTMWVEGLGIEGRLRYPLMPIEFLYAAYGWCLLRKKKERNPNRRLRLLVITQRVDSRDTNLAVHVRWLNEFAGLCESVTVIAQSVGMYELPSNVRVLSLGKEHDTLKLVQFYRFYRHVWRETRNVDSMLVLMVPLYVLLVAKIAFWRRKPIYLWYTHKRVSMTLRVATLFVRRVFSASPASFRLKTPKVHYMGHAIDTDFFTPDPSVSRTPGKLVTVGRVTQVKRLDVLIEAVANLRKQGRDVTLDIVGVTVVDQDREYEKRLHEQILRLGLDGQVTFRGGQSEEQVRRAYQTSSVCLNASATGSLDKAVLEAMACGCPVVTSNEAFTAIVPPDYFVPSGTANAFAEAIPLPRSSDKSLQIEIHCHRASRSASNAWSVSVGDASDSIMILCHTKHGNDMSSRDVGRVILHRSIRCCVFSRRHVSRSAWGTES